MKIIKNGISKTPENKPENYWWLNYEFRCKCECIFKLELNDYQRLLQINDQLNVENINLHCPYCNVRLRVTKPIRKNKWPDTDINNPALFDSIFGDGGVFSKIFGEKPFKK